MIIEVLGSAGAITTPVPGCGCHVCTLAREKGLPHTRTGPSIFIHEKNILFDTPEESKYQLNRANIKRIESCFYSHWHPDHVMGRRVFETINADWRNWPPEIKTSDVYLPQQVAVDFRKTLGSWDHFKFFEKQGFVRIIELKDGEKVHIGTITITPYRLAVGYVYAFLVEENKKRVFIAMDELASWVPPEELLFCDLAILPAGIFDIHPTSGKRNISIDHPVLQSEATFSQTLEIVKMMKPSRTIFIHIEEPDCVSCDELLQVETKIKEQGMSIRFAYDTMKIDV